MTFLHTVHFWLREDLDEADRSRFLDACRGLGASPNVGSIRVGVPAGTPREVVDNSYDVQLTCGFDSSEAHDRYQSAEDEAHQRFIAENQHAWTRVLIYDSVEA